MWWLEIPGSESVLEEKEKLDWDIVTGGIDQEMLEKARAYAQRLDVDVLSSPPGHAFINGRHVDVNDASVIAYSLKYEG